MTRQGSRRALFWLWAVAVPVVGAMPAKAQSPTTGALSGVVREATGELLATVFLTLRDERTGLERSQFSDRDGGYRFELLVSGEYELMVEKLGYGPKRVIRIPVRPGSELRLDQTLVALDPSAARAEVESFEGRAAMGSRAGATQWLPEWVGRTLPHVRRDVSETARLTSLTDRGLGVEGLAPWHTALVLDGTPFRPAAHPLLWSAPLRGTAFGLGGVQAAQVVTNGVDVEWSGAAGGWLSAHSRRGAETLELEGRGAWTGSVLPGQSFGDGLTYNDAQGSFALLAPLLGDSARLSAGLEVQRLQTPVSRTWGDSPAAVTLSGLGESFGLDLASYRRPALAESNAIAGFLRFDWNLAGRHRFATWMQLASQPHLTGADGRLGTLQQVEGADVVAGANLRSDLRQGLGNELRVAVTSSWRATADVAAVGPTWIVSDGLVLGGLRSAARGEETRVLLSDAVHLTTGRHAVKVGAGVTLASQRYDYRSGSEGEYYFGSLNDVLAGRGLTVRADGTTPAARWNTTSPQLFVQNRWNAGQGLDVQVGGRMERTPLPVGNVDLDEDWERLSGLRNDSIGGTGWRREARIGLTWDVQESRRWIVHLAGGLYSDEIDPLLLNQWQTDAGSGRVRREFGVFNWPADAPGGGSYRRVTMLAPGFAAPQTTRGSAGLTYRLNDVSALHVSGAVRRTENLPRRTDLNLLPLPTYRDQYDRAVFGTPVQHGGLLMAEPGTGRRFTAYDEAAGINADGWSDYWGVTAGLEREVPGGTAFVVRYTFSSTRDNWFGGRDGGWTAAPPRGIEGAREWTEGVSDFDVPHRLAAGVSLPLPLDARLAAVYRLESGVPFTPGFRRGVDASADGSFGNDPAFIDPAFAGMADMISRWPCLAESRGTFAARNSCRAASSHTIDLALAADVFRIGGGVASLTAEAFDIVASARAMPDAALYLVDPAGTLAVDNVARTVNVPLLINTDFGEALTRPHGGRRFRLGLTVKW